MSHSTSSLIGFDWRGVLVHDGWAVYDAFTRAEHQTCVAHLLRRSDELLKVATRGAVRFPRAVKELLKRAFGVRDRFLARELSERGVRVLRGRLTAELDRLVTPIKSHAVNERFAKFFRTHADQLFTFLRPEFLGVIEATNWRAEQAIRPAVVNRKVWGATEPIGAPTPRRPSRPRWSPSLNRPPTPSSGSPEPVRASIRYPSPADRR